LVTQILVVKCKSFSSLALRELGLYHITPYSEFFLMTATHSSFHYFFPGFKAYWRCESSQCDFPAFLLEEEFWYPTALFEARVSTPVEPSTFSKVVI
jgi:hypothetical protein